MNWFDSSHCASRAHCFACRNDHAFRESICRAGMVKEADFACPWNLNPPKQSQCGSRLSSILRFLGFTPCEGCRSMETMMNAWGPAGCLEHMADILASLKAGAADPKSNPHHLPFSEMGARALVGICLRTS